MKTIFSFLLSVVILSSVGISFAFAKSKPAVEIFPYDNAYSSLQRSIQPRNDMSQYTRQPHNQAILTKPETSLSYKDFMNVADQTVNSLIQRNSDGFIHRVSPNMVRHFGAHKIEKNVVSTLIPYFQEFKSFDTKMTVAPTRDAWNNEGYSFYQTFKTKAGAEKEFVVQLVIENGRIVVANLTPDVSSPYK